jgi:hypothetical protein
MATNLRRIRERARKNPGEVFTSLWHHVCDEDHLRACYEALDGKKAAGIDGVDKKVYGENLEVNLKELSAKLQRLGYRPQAKRRRYIPKAGREKGRPLAISNFEDKIVERAIKVVLEQIYEEDFEDSSYGYYPSFVGLCGVASHQRSAPRGQWPGRTQHQCLDDLGRTIQQKRVSYVVEADIRSFFDKVKHGWMMKFLRHRVGDKRLLRMIERMLKAGILEDGLVQTSDEGTPQGSILSPLLSQGQAPNQPQETGSEPEEVQRVVSREPPLDDQRADVALGESPDRRPSQLLRDHGQQQTMRGIRLPGNAHTV